MTNTTIRQQVTDAIPEQAAEYERNSHETNYYKLHVYRDGALRWHESINQSDDIIDDDADHFAAIPSLCCTGTGSVSCDCACCLNVYSAEAEEQAKDDDREYDRDHKYETRQDAIDDAVANSDLSVIETMMTEVLDGIEFGYFDDEELDDEELDDEEQ
jgi:hypothetical protein